jgi:hypothetical protein
MISIVAQGSSFTVGIQKESSYGVTPSPANLVGVPNNSFSINTTRTEILSEEMGTGHRNFVQMGNESIAGDIAVEFAPSIYDTLLEGVMQSTFSTGALKHGTGLVGHHIEARYNDTTDYRLFRGCIFNQVEMSYELDGLVTATFGIIGREEVVSGTSFDASLTMPSFTPKFSGLDVAFTYGGSAIKPMSASFTVNNNASQDFVLGSKLLEAMGKGFIDVTGSFEVLLTDMTLLSAFKTDTEEELAITLDNGVSDIYTFTFPKTKLTEVSTTASGLSSQRLACSFRATYDSVSASTLVITKEAQA